MEDHVRRILIPPLAVALGSAALVTGRLALSATAASVEWAGLATLLGAAAALVGLGARRAAPALRAPALAAGIAGAGVAMLLLGQATFLVARAFRSGGPSLSVGRSPASGR